MVFLCCRTVGLNQQESYDVASETFLAAYKSLDRYRFRCGLSTWVWKIAYHKAVDCLRKKKQYYQLFEEVSQQQQEAEDDTVKVETADQAQIIWQAVERLPKLWATAIILFYREQKRIIEIAEIMNTGQNTVKTYLFRGRTRLKELLPDNFGVDFYDNG
jgi:RNA polymerase sigma-70 factor (ECF subfamily)